MPTVQQGLSRRADLLYAPGQVDTRLFANAFALHFCGAALVESPMRETHRAAIAAARDAGAIASYPDAARMGL
ncbi:MAG: hypothetical protein PUF05_09140 [Gemmiger formicilis]|nr:hypothetical protein [Gemmiger formicilis]